MVSGPVVIMMVFLRNHNSEAEWVARRENSQ
jgi:hypothetical protein